jgi:hypothetical protein
MVKMQYSATMYGMGMIQASIFNLIWTMVFFMWSGGCFITLFNMDIFRIQFYKWLEGDLTPCSTCDNWFVKRCKIPQKCGIWIGHQHICLFHSPC